MGRYHLLNWKLNQPRLERSSRTSFFVYRAYNIGSGIKNFFEILKIMQYYNKYDNIYKSINERKLNKMKTIKSKKH